MMVYLQSSSGEVPGVDVAVSTARVQSGALHEEEEERLGEGKRKGRG